MSLSCFGAPWPGVDLCSYELEVSLYNSEAKLEQHISGKSNESWCNRAEEVTKERMEECTCLRLKLSGVLVGCAGFALSSQEVFSDLRAVKEQY